MPPVTAAVRIRRVVALCAVLADGAMGCGGGDEAAPESAGDSGPDRGATAEGGDMTLGAGPDGGGVATDAAPAASDGGGADQGAGDLPAGAPAVRLVGRFDRRDAGGPRFAWSGSGIVARFAGTSVGVRLGGGQQFTVVLDDTLQPKLVPMPGGALTPIAAGLPPGEHTVTLYRRTEASQGESQFLGFDFGDGMLLAPPPAPARRIEMVGDSITCGYGVEGTDMNCAYTADTQNQYLAYGDITGRTLGADVVTLAWSGKGVVCNYGDDPTSCLDPFPIYYDRVLPNRADSQWDFSWQPHVVVVNLGTNDFSTATDPAPEQFSEAYRTFLLHIRGKYPAALILGTVAPLLDGADLTSARAAIDAAVAATGDARIKSFTMDPTDPADGFGCDYHPSIKTQQKMAAALTARLQQELGW